MLSREGREQGGGVVKRAKKPRLQREKLVALLAKEARRLAAKGGQANFTRLDELLDEGLGWDWSRSHGYVDHHARAIEALAPLATDKDLEYAAYLAVWRRIGGKATSEEENAEVRKVLAPLGVQFAACGCLAQTAGDACCDRDVARRKELEATALALLDTLKDGNTKLYAEALADLGKRVDALKLKKTVESKEAA